VGRGERDGADERPVDDDVGDGGLQAQGDPPPANCCFHGYAGGQLSPGHQSREADPTAAALPIIWSQRVTDQLESHKPGISVG
jgi:hypothetical protein